MRPIVWDSHRDSLNSALFRFLFFMLYVPITFHSFDTDEESPKLNGKFYEGTEEIEIDLSKVVYPGNSYS